MFRTDALEDVLVFLAVKAAQGVPAEEYPPRSFCLPRPRVVRDESQRRPYPWARI